MLYLSAHAMLRGLQGEAIMLTIIHEDIMKQPNPTYVNRYQGLAHERDRILGKISNLRERRHAIGEPDDAYYDDCNDATWAKFDSDLEKLNSELQEFIT